MFEKFKKQLAEDKPKEVKQVGMNYTSLSEDVYKKKLMDINKLPDQEVFDIVSKSYRMIFDDIFVKKNPKLIHEVSTSPKFITALMQLFNNPNVAIDLDTLIYCNKMAYDYFHIYNEYEQKDSHVLELLQQLTRIINRNIIPGLIGLGLPETLAIYLANARFSSKKDFVQVRRLNVIICSEPVELMTEQMIVDIYGKLFDRITPLFEGIMYDVWEEKDFEYSMEGAREIYGTINLALLDIVNNLPNDIMEKLLTTFVDTHQMIRADNKLRFNINSFSPDDYPRLDTMIQNLKTRGIYLPS